MKRTTTTPLDTGTVDEVKESKALRQCHLRQVDPLSKALISGSVDEFQKLDGHQDFRESIHCPKPIKLSADEVHHSIYPALRGPPDALRQMPLPNRKNVHISRRIRPTPPILLAGGGGGQVHLMLYVLPFLAFRQRHDMAERGLAKNRQVSYPSVPDSCA